VSLQEKAGNAAILAGRGPEALTFLGLAANAGSSSAQVRLGQLYENGDFVQEDDQQALQWFEKATRSGDTEGMGELGYLLAQSKISDERRRGIQLCEKAAASHSETGEGCLRDLYAAGQGLTKNMVEAVKYADLAASTGYLNELLHTMVFYQGDKHGPVDLQKAIVYARKAASLGHPGAAQWLAEHYINGTGVASDPKLGFQLYVYIAGETDHAPIYYERLGQLYKDGIGTQKNLIEAKRWLKKALADGQTSAEASLADVREGLGEISRTSVALQGSPACPDWKDAAQLAVVWGLNNAAALSHVLARTSCVLLDDDLDLTGERLTETKLGGRFSVYFDSRRNLYFTAVEYRTQEH